MCLVAVLSYSLAVWSTVEKNYRELKGCIDIVVAGAFEWYRFRKVEMKLKISAKS
jgi:hypothetical protein